MFIIKNNKNEKEYYMIYNPDNGILYGITENCYNSFGINSNFVVGHFTNSKEFNVETIAPDLLL